MEPATLDEGPRPGPEVDGRGVEVLAPRMLVSVREDEEQPAHLDAAAGAEQRRELAGSQRHQALEDIVEIVEAGVARQLVEGFEDGAFRRRRQDTPAPHIDRRPGGDVELLDAEGVGEKGAWVHDDVRRRWHAL